MVNAALARSAKAAVLLAALVACGPVRRAAQGYANPPPHELARSLESGALRDAPAWLRGQHRLAYDDFGSLDTDLLSTYGIPWKLAAAALVLHRADFDGSPPSAATLRAVLTDFGFIFPHRIGNWDGPSPARFERPIGLLAGVASRRLPAVEVEIAGFGCAACHAGVMYDAGGLPLREAWLGLPNTSLDLTAYADTLLVAMQRAVASPERTLRAVRSLFPDVSHREVRTLERHGIPRARARFAELERRHGRAVPFVNGGPGLSNGIASLRHQLGLPVDGAAAHSFVSIPYIGERHLRSALLVDGGYRATRPATETGPATGDVTDVQFDALAGIIALFTVPTQGVTIAKARDAIPAMHDVARYIARIRPPRFPGSIDTTLALSGAGLFRNRCAGCHGEMSPGLGDVRPSRFELVLVPQSQMETDPTRWMAADSSAVARLRTIGFERWLDPLATGMYAAPPLTGIWATAPYLHNGSVPTLWHLMHPDARPARFEVGGHALDLERVGIAGDIAADGAYRYPPSYTPWSRPAVYDTREPGKANSGHARQFHGLDDAQKRAILEYLKVL